MEKIIIDLTQLKEIVKQFEKYSKTENRLKRYTLGFGDVELVVQNLSLSDLFA